MFLPLRGSLTSFRHSFCIGSSCTISPRSPKVGQRLAILVADSFVRIVRPHALEQHHRALPVGTIGDAGVQHLLVERDDHVGFVAHVGDVRRAHADADAAGALAFTRRRLDFGRDDLDGPDPVAHLAAHKPEYLAAFLRALAGVADDFDDLLVDLAQSFLHLAVCARIVSRFFHNRGPVATLLCLDLVEFAAEFFDRSPTGIAGGLDIVGVQ